MVFVPAEQFTDDDLLPLPERSCSTASVSTMYWRRAAPDRSAGWSSRRYAIINAATEKWSGAIMTALLRKLLACALFAAASPTYAASFECLEDNQV